MRLEGTPPLDPHSLRLQIDAILPVIANLALADPNHEISGRVLGNILTILDVIRQQHGSRLILDAGIGELLIAQAPEEPPLLRSAPLPEPISALEIQIALASVRASLLALEELEARTATYDSSVNAEASFQSSDTYNRDSSPGGRRNWREDPGDRQYRIVAGSQFRHTAVDRPRGLPW